MTVPKDFSLFLHSEGRPLAEIDLGSEEQALKPAAALQALELLAGDDVAILGGMCSASPQGGSNTHTKIGIANAYHGRAHAFSLLEVVQSLVSSSRN